MDERALWNLGRAIYGKTREASLAFAKKAPDIEPLIWPSWERLPELMRTEHVEWAEHLLKTEQFDFSIDSRHVFAVVRRFADGWTLGDDLNIERKTYPYLMPMSDCPGSFQEWAMLKDAIMVEGCKEALCRGSYDSLRI